MIRRAHSVDDGPRPPHSTPRPARTSRSPLVSLLPSLLPPSSGMAAAACCRRSTLDAKLPEAYRAEPTSQSRLSVTARASAGVRQPGNMSSTCRMPARPCAAPRYRVPCHAYISGGPPPAPPPLAAAAAPARPCATTAATMGAVTAAGMSGSWHALLTYAHAYRKPARPYSSSSGVAGSASTCDPANDSSSATELSRPLTSPAWCAAAADSACRPGCGGWGWGWVSGRQALSHLHPAHACPAPPHSTPHTRSLPEPPTPQTHLPREERRVGAVRRVRQHRRVEHVAAVAQRRREVAGARRTLHLGKVVQEHDRQPADARVHVRARQLVEHGRVGLRQAGAQLVRVRLDGARHRRPRLGAQLRQLVGPAARVRHRGRVEGVAQPRPDLWPGQCGASRPDAWLGKRRGGARGRGEADVRT